MRVSSPVGTLRAGSSGGQVRALRPCATAATANKPAAPATHPLEFGRWCPVGCKARCTPPPPTPAPHPSTSPPPTRPPKASAPDVLAEGYLGRTQSLQHGRHVGGGALEGQLRAVGVQGHGAAAQRRDGTRRVQGGTVLPHSRGPQSGGHPRAPPAWTGGSRVSSQSVRWGPAVGGAAAAQGSEPRRQLRCCASASALPEFP